MSMREYESKGEKKTAWTKIGTGWTNKNGSINVQLDAFPLDGKIQLQVPLTEEQWAARKQGPGGQRQGGGGNQQRYRQGTSRQQAAPMPAGNMFAPGGQTQEYDPNVDGEPEY